eukprot:CAMPEP_0206247774 /NCGR_PEP_ID=MMETSP0047_2-20121206/19999_1 /ASSEMBLY_ACC=CAM_ASM_000192 /TAXON_ID=195065 /ORGANISM="Chroomonas mesostigmatica_cf, Strain CCMP1168" /LENGTH=107 /DNA_ID=CAMNT_0053673341 /DNA_START=334 /DNA_END=657 /DNA_ORIENTATION=+
MKCSAQTKETARQSWVPPQGSQRAQAHGPTPPVLNESTSGGRRRESLGLCFPMPLCARSASRFALASPSVTLCPSKSRRYAPTASTCEGSAASARRYARSVSSRTFA